MRRLTFMALSIGLSLSCIAQQKQADTTVVKFTPPVVVKDNKSDKTGKEKETKFTPPVIVKDKPSKNKGNKSSKQPRFQPPVIIKNEETKEQ